MYTISLKDGAVLGQVSEADLQILVDQFEEESSTDRDYYVCEPTIGILEEAGASPDFVAMLRRATAGTDGIDIVWKAG
jgi:hypothetical protein